MTEELAFEESIRQCRAVDAHEGVSGSAGCCNGLLPPGAPSGPGFPGEDDARAAFGDFFDKSERLPNPGASPDEVLGPIDQRPFTAEYLAFLVQAFQLDAFVDLDLELGQIDRLQDEIRCSFADCADCFVEFASFAHRDHDCIAVVLPDQAQQVFRREIHVVNIENHHVEYLLPESLQSAHAVGSDIDEKPCAPK